MKEGILLGDSSAIHVLRLRELSSVRHCLPYLHLYLKAFRPDLGGQMLRDPNHSFQIGL